jgi:V-containing nitrogenase delta subunit
MKKTRVDELYTYVQERCLWQFFSRTWDRKENIEGVFDNVVRLLTDEEPARGTPMERLHYVDALTVVKDFKEQFPWITDCKAAEIKDLMDEVKARVTDITVTHSKNHELSHHLY